MTPIKYDPKAGQAYQGDVVILPMPSGIGIDTAAEVPMRNGMLVLAEGEVTGHHHAIRYGLDCVSKFHDGALARDIETGAIAKIGTAKMYRDPEALAELLNLGILVTDALCIGFLVVEGTCPPLTHDEHGAIGIPPGSYYVGAKREMDIASERRVAD